MHQHESIWIQKIYGVILRNQKDFTVFTVSINTKANIINSKHSYYDCLAVSWKYGYEKEYFWVSGILLGIVAIIGFIGNIINIVVLCQPELRQKVFYKLLVVLAIFDSIYSYIAFLI